MKDITHNLDNMRESSRDEKYELYTALSKDVAAFFELTAEPIEQFSDEYLQKLTAVSEEIHTRTNTLILELFNKKIPVIDITSMLNVNSDVFNSFKQIIHSLKELAAGRENFSL